MFWGNNTFGLICANLLCVYLLFSTGVVIVIIFGDMFARNRRRRG